MIRVAYLPLGRVTFDIEAARDVVRRSRAVLAQLDVELAAPDDVLTSVADLETFLSSLPAPPGLVVYQAATFVDAQFTRAVVAAVDAPVVVWSVLEPEVGGRLRLNSLTGGNIAAHHLRQAGRGYAFVYGDPDDERVRADLARQARVRALMDDLADLVVGVVGSHPPGFFFSDTDEDALRRVLGVRVHRMDLRGAFARAGDVPAERWRPLVDEVAQTVIALERDDQTVERFARFAVSLRDYCAEHGIRATAVECWPQFFDEYGAAACSTVSLLNDTGTVSACEADIHGAITMHALQALGGGPAYLGDLVAADPDENSLVFWHCGAGAFSLARPTEGPRAGVHPNRGIGFTLEMALKPGVVTVARLGWDGDRLRLLALRGEALDRPQRFLGTSVVVRPAVPARSLLQTLMEQGWEPHYGLVYGDCVDDLRELGRQLGIEVAAFDGRGTGPW